MSFFSSGSISSEVFRRLKETLRCADKEFDEACSEIDASTNKQVDEIYQRADDDAERQYESAQHVKEEKKRFIIKNILNGLL